MPAELPFAAGGTTDAPPERPYRRRTADPFKRATQKSHRETETEMGFGAGLVAPHLNGRPPSEGGIYMPKAPRVELPAGSLTPRQVRRPRGEARGYPGDPVAR